MNIKTELPNPNKTGSPRERSRSPGFIEIRHALIDQECESPHLFVGQKLGFGRRDFAPDNEGNVWSGITDEIPIGLQFETRFFAR